MAIYQPSQYECDNMKPGDYIIVRDRSRLYKWYRTHFQKDKLILRLNPNSYIAGFRYEYQEDCTLVYKYEMESIQSLKNEIPCIISINSNSFGGYNTLLKEVKINLINMQFIFKNNLTFTIPIKGIEDAILKNRKILESSRDEQKIYENLKYKKYKGDYFKNRVKERNIDTWVPAYCSVCGNPILFNFDDNGIKVVNKCNCDNIVLEYNELTYDEFASWYYSQLVDSFLGKRYKEFWFGD